jgi:hypothetical protein
MRCKPGLSVLDTLPSGSRGCSGANTPTSAGGSRVSWQAYKIGQVGATLPYNKSLSCCAGTCTRALPRPAKIAGCCQQPGTEAAAVAHLAS